MQYKDKKIVLDPEEFSNYICIDGIDYQLEYLDSDDPKKSCSPNGFLFKLRDMQEEVVTSVIKICPVFQPCNDGWMQRRLERFKREIIALKMVKENKLNNHAIEIYACGDVVISNKEFLFYTMELGSCDLSTFLRNELIEIPEKYRICAEIMKSVESLHQIGIYHRDIKPGNFIMVGNTWKIADLGLVDFREEDIPTLDEIKEKIGPRGYLSPEAINKWLGVNRDPILISIDDKSDVFQLAKVIGFILLGEILTGIVEPTDFSRGYDHSSLCLLLTKAMQYAKVRRCDLSTLRSGFVGAYGKEYAFS